VGKLPAKLVKKKPSGGKQTPQGGPIQKKKIPFGRGIVVPENLIQNQKMGNIHFQLILKRITAPGVRKTS